MQQRARRRHPQSFPEFVSQGLKHLNDLTKIGAPNISAIDDACRQHHAGRQRRAPGVELRRGADEI
jgi:hypothetical protein